MTEYERLSLALQTNILAGISMMVTQGNMTTAENRAAHSEQVVEWLRQVRDLTHKVNEAVERGQTT